MKGTLGLFLANIAVKGFVFSFFICTFALSIVKPIATTFPFDNEHHETYSFFDSFCMADSACLCHSFMPYSAL